MRSDRATGRQRVLARGLMVALAFAGVGAATACSGGSSDSADTAADAEIEGGLTRPSDEELAALDARPDVRSALGTPDAFELVFDELDGTPARRERWTYYGQDTVVEFLDGTLLWTTEAGVPAVSDGTAFAHFYDPDQFSAGMSLSDVTALVEAAGEGHTLTEVDVSEGGVVDARVFTGPQIVVAFAGPILVNVETFAVGPDGQS